MEKFTDVYERWQQRALSQVEAAEILGRSERQFRRYCDQFEADGLRDQWLSKPSGNALPQDVEAAILALYRKTYLGGT